MTSSSKYTANDENNTYYSGINIPSKVENITLKEARPDSQETSIIITGVASRDIPSSPIGSPKADLANSLANRRNRSGNERSITSNGPTSPASREVAPPRRSAARRSSLALSLSGIAEIQSQFAEIGEVGNSSDEDSLDEGLDSRVDNTATKVTQTSTSPANFSTRKSSIREHIPIDLDSLLPAEIQLELEEEDRKNPNPEVSKQEITTVEPSKAEVSEAENTATNNKRVSEKTDLRKTSSEKTQLISKENVDLPGSRVQPRKSEPLLKPLNAKPRPAPIKVNSSFHSFTHFASAKSTRASSLGGKRASSPTTGAQSPKAGTSSPNASASLKSTPNASKRNFIVDFASRVRNSGVDRKSTTSVDRRSTNSAPSPVSGAPKKGIFGTVTNFVSRNLTPKAKRNPSAGEPVGSRELFDSIGFGDIKDSSSGKSSPKNVSAVKRISFFDQGSIALTEKEQQEDEPEEQPEEEENEDQNANRIDNKGNTVNELSKERTLTSTGDPITPDSDESELDPDDEARPISVCKSQTDKTSLSLLDTLRAIAHGNHRTNNTRKSQKIKKKSAGSKRLFNMEDDSSVTSYRRRRHSLDGSQASEKILQNIKADTLALVRKYRVIKPEIDRLWKSNDRETHAFNAANKEKGLPLIVAPGANSPSQQHMEKINIGNLKIEVKRLQEEANRITGLLQCLDASSNLRRWSEAHIQMVLYMHKRFSENTLLYSWKASAKLLGIQSYDGLVYDVDLKDPAGFQGCLANGADAMECDTFKKTSAHNMALAGFLPFHIENWHCMRLNTLKKRGADLRSAIDYHGRSPMLIALEEFNIAFIRALLRVELGEDWAMRIFRRVPPFNEQGELLKKSLEVQTLRKKIMPVKIKQYAKTREDREKVFQQRERERANARDEDLDILMNSTNGPNSPTGFNTARRGTILIQPINLLKDPNEAAKKRNKPDPKTIYSDELTVYLLEMFPKIVPRSLCRQGIIMTYSPFHWAAFEGDVEALVCAMMMGIDLNISSLDVRSPAAMTTFLTDVQQVYKRTISEFEHTYGYVPYETTTIVTNSGNANGNGGNSSGGTASGTAVTHVMSGELVTPRDMSYSKQSPSSEGELLETASGTADNISEHRSAWKKDLGSASNKNLDKPRILQKSVQSAKSNFLDVHTMYKNLISATKDGWIDQDAADYVRSSHTLNSGGRGRQSFAGALVTAHLSTAQGNGGLNTNTNGDSPNNGGTIDAGSPQDVAKHGTNVSKQGVGGSENPSVEELKRFPKNSLGAILKGHVSLTQSSVRAGRIPKMSSEKSISKPEAHDNVNGLSTAERMDKLLRKNLRQMPQLRLETPLHVAIAEGHADCVRILLQAKANPNFTSNPLAVAYMYAKHLEHYKHVKNQNVVTSMFTQSLLNNNFPLANFNSTSGGLGSVSTTLRPEPFNPQTVSGLSGKTAYGQLLPTLLQAVPAGVTKMENAGEDGLERNNGSKDSTGQQARFADTQGRLPVPSFSSPPALASPRDQLVADVLMQQQQVALQQQEAAGADKLQQDQNRTGESQVDLAVQAADQQAVSQQHPHVVPEGGKSTENIPVAQRATVAVSQLRQQQGLSPPPNVTPLQLPTGDAVVNSALHEQLDMAVLRYDALSLAEQSGDWEIKSLLRDAVDKTKDRKTRKTRGANNNMLTSTAVLFDGMVVKNTNLNIGSGRDQSKSTSGSKTLPGAVDAVDKRDTSKQKTAAEETGTPEGTTLELDPETLMASRGKKNAPKFSHGVKVISDDDDKEHKSSIAEIPMLCMSRMEKSTFSGDVASKKGQPSVFVKDYVPAEECGWDSVFLIAELMESESFCRTLEDLCIWYRNLGPSSYQRVYSFWSFYGRVWTKEKLQGRGSFVRKSASKEMTESSLKAPSGRDTVLPSSINL